jgi:hypothetical protein
MGKKSRLKARSAAPAERPGIAAATADQDEVPVVGPRQPCPCGSGRRYKACHGRTSGAAPAFVARPFEGLAGECDLIAMREIVATATAPVRLRDGFPGGERPVRLCSLLPTAAPALSRADGSVWLGLQVQHGFGDPSRDLAAVLLKALRAAPGEGVVGLTDAPGPGPRLQDLLADEPLEVTVHEGFDYWVADTDDPTGSAAASVESANTAVSRSSRLTSVTAAYWTDVRTREHLRWVMPYDEEPLLDALARLHVAGRDRVAEGSRLVGMFRAHGRLVPVWDLPPGTGAEVLEEPAAELGGALAETLQDARPLTTEERAARSGLANRQLTIR